MRFLILTQYFSPEVGAPQIRLSAFARELIRQGHCVEVVTALPNYPRGRIFEGYRTRWNVCETIDGIRVHRTWVYASLGAGWKRAVSFASFAITSLSGLLKCARPDWIFVESPPLTLVLPSILAARLWRVPVIMNVADLWPDSIRALGLARGSVVMKSLEKLEQFAYAQSDMISAVTDGVRQSLVGEKGVPASKIVLLENGVDPDTFRPRSPDEELKRTLRIENQKIVLFAGTHGFAQGLENALAAAKLLENESIHFLFIGDGSAKNRLIQLASQWRLRNVTFLAPMDPNTVARYFSISDCGLACQRDVHLLEGNRPAKITSIMACGKPVVFAGKGEGARLVEHARAGVVVQPEDSLALANAIRNVVSNPVSAAQIGRNGRAFVEEHFTWDSLVREWLTQVLAFRKSVPVARARCPGFGGSMTIAGGNTRIVPPQPPGSSGSPGAPHLSELRRIREAYARRQRSIPASRYSSLDRAHVFQTDELKTSLRRLLRRRSATSLAEARILDVGCGDGRWLRVLGEFGAQPQNLSGVDLLPERIELARKLYSPLTTLICGDASSLPFADSTFDILLSFTAFSSIQDPALKASLAAEMLRVLRPGGIVLWYDFCVNNPRNPDAVGITKREVEGLFSGHRVELERITLAPPLARLVAWSNPLLKSLSSVRFLRTHYFGSITK